MKKWIVAAWCVLSINAIAGTMGEPYRPWSVLGSLGYTWFNQAYSGGPNADPLAQNAIGDGQTALGRFAIARDVGSMIWTHPPF